MSEEFGNVANRRKSYHDELLTELLKSMRYDLYKDRKVNDSYPIIHLTGKAPRSN